MTDPRCHTTSTETAYWIERPDQVSRQILADTLEHVESLARTVFILSISVVALALAIATFCLLITVAS